MKTPITRPAPITNAGSSTSKRSQRGGVPTITAQTVVILGSVTDTNYGSGDDYVVTFLGYRFSFNAEDFEQRVVAAAVKLGLVEANELDEEETADLVELAAEGRIEEARSQFARYLVPHWGRTSPLRGECSL